MLTYHLSFLLLQMQKKRISASYSDQWWKWILFDNPSLRIKGYPDQQISTPMRNIYGSKVMFCVRWRHQNGIYYELLKSRETITGDRFRKELVKLNRALEEQRPQYANRHNKVIFRNDNAWPHIIKPVKINWKHYDGKFCPVRHTLQTLFNLITTSSEQWPITYTIITSTVSKIFNNLFC